MRTLGLILIACVAACGGGDPSTGAVTTESAEPYCRAGCEHISDCEGNEVEPCVDGCVDDVAGWYREDALAELVDCVTSLPCGASDDTCPLRCTPTSSHERYEAACRDALTACGVPSSDQAMCETTPSGDGDTGFLCAIAPVIMEELAGCFTDPDVTCATYEPCLQNVLETRGIDF